MNGKLAALQPKCSPIVYAQRAAEIFISFFLRDFEQLLTSVREGRLRRANTTTCQ